MNTPFNTSWLTLRDLEYLVAVADYSHFGKAAESCHVSQPTLSAQIRKIEDFLETTLFERTNRKVSITEAGRRVADQAKVVLEEASKLLAAAGPGAKPLTRSLRLGAIATLGPFLIPRFLAPLKKEFPSLNLLLQEGLTDALLHGLRQGSLDAVLAARTFDEKGFRVFSLYREPFVLAAPAGHPLAKLKPLRARDLNAEEMVLLEDGHCLRDQTIDLCPANRRGHVRQFHATSIETLRHLVASGLGYTLLPKLAVQDKAMRDLVSYREFEQSSVSREIVLVCRESYPQMKDIETLAAFLVRNRPKELVAS